MFNFVTESSKLRVLLSPEMCKYKYKFRVPNYRIGTFEVNLSIDIAEKKKKDFCLVAIAISMESRFFFSISKFVL